ncbi:MAG: hypothetical protein KA419_11960, partial [Acidobacteria bacterium]|nr:hypothetical protein [Acidobacteriota bacterium]
PGETSSLLAPAKSSLSARPIENQSLASPKTAVFGLIPDRREHPVGRPGLPVPLGDLGAFA